MAATMLRSIRGRFSGLSQKFVLPEKYKGGRIEKLVDYIKLVYSDYTTALQEGWVDAKARPLKASFYTSLSLSAIIAAATNPTIDDFISQRTERSIDMGLVANPVRSKKSTEHLIYINRLLNQQRVRRLNLVFFSVLVELPLNAECQLFENQCKYLQHSYFEMFQKDVVDIGIFGKYWILDAKMKDYDINEEEFLKSPQPLYQ